jgi:hypothetical protein
MSRDLLVRAIAYRMRELAYGGLSKATHRKLMALTKELATKGSIVCDRDREIRPGMQLCHLYTRKSSEEGLEQDFNSLDAQREAGEAFIASQKHEGWTALKEMYNDGGFSGATIERPAFQRLLADVGKGRIDVVVVYKVDRLTRSLSDFV